MAYAPGWETYSEQGLKELLLGNEHAFSFMLALARCSHIYDDLIDRDKPVSDSDIHELMWLTMFAIPTNPFFAAHADRLRPCILTGLLNWHAATEIERNGTVEELRLAHAMRYSLADVLLMVLEIVGGHAYAMQNARRARLMQQNDTWAHYLEEHSHTEQQHAKAQTD